MLVVATSSTSAVAVAVALRGTAALKASPRVSSSSSRGIRNTTCCSALRKNASVATKKSTNARNDALVARAASDDSSSTTSTTTTTSTTPSLADTEALPANDNSFPPTAPCVYAVLDSSDNVQYVGMSRRLPATIAGHVSSNELSSTGKVSSVKFAALPAAATREELTEAWRAWVQEVVDTSGAPPPGNLPDQQPLWAPRARGGAPPPPPEIRLTPGKGIEDLTVPLDTLISQVISDHHVVAFIKGTRREPQCGFSHSVLTMLTAACSAAGEAAQFQVVNVLDEQYNPGLREAIKQFSAWPTIPQTFIGGEFVGGADIVAELASSGELVELIKKKNK